MMSEVTGGGAKRAMHAWWHEQGYDVEGILFRPYRYDSERAGRECAAFINVLRKGDAEPAKYRLATCFVHDVGGVTVYSDRREHVFGILDESEYEIVNPKACIVSRTRRGTKSEEPFSGAPHDEVDRLFSAFDGEVTDAPSWFAGLIRPPEGTDPLVNAIACARVNETVIELPVIIFRTKEERWLFRQRNPQHGFSRTVGLRVQGRGSRRIRQSLYFYMTCIRKDLLRTQ